MMNFTRRIICAMVLLSAWSPSPAQVFINRSDAWTAPIPALGLNFAPVVNYDSGGSDAFSVAVADVNRDSKVDLLVVNQCASTSSCVNGTVGVLLGNGNGTFQTAVTYNSGGFNPSSIAVADVNGDGKPDLLVTNVCASYGNCPSGGSVSVLLGNGDGTFRAAVAYASGAVDTNSVAVADVNCDGKLDLIVASDCITSGCVNGVVGVLLGNGDGTFQAAVSYETNAVYAYSVAVADVSGDGIPDLLVANLSNNNGTSGAVSVLLGNGDGTFRAPVIYGSGGYESLSIAVADVNKDGKLDLVVSNTCINGNNCNNGAVGVLLGNGDGTFQTAVSYGSGGSDGGLVTGSVAVGDVNGDGNPDIVVVNQGNGNEGNLGVLLGNGNGTFQPAVTYGAGGYYATSVGIGDVNGDGKPDLVVANRCMSPGSDCGATSDGSVGVLINASLKAAQNWTEFHTLDMVRWNPYEHVLNVENVGRLKKLGSYTTGGPVFSSSPAIVNGVGYFGSDDDNVYAVNVHTGAKVWSYATGGYVQSSPAVANGVAYVGSYDHNVYALNASTGALLWKYATGNGVQSSPTVANGIVFVGSLDHNVYALNASTGAKVWSYTTGNVVYSSPAVVDGIVYFGSYDNNVYALDANTGALRWSYATGNEVYSSPAVANGMVYIGSYDKNVYALDASTGALRWAYATGDVVPSSPAVANGTVYVGSQDNNVYALDASTGVLLWNYTTNSFVFSSPAVANGVVYVGSYDDGLYALDASTGGKLWSYSTGNAVTSSPVVVNGVVYVGSNDDTGYAFGLPRE
jgi:outer membrane protein assembly factor BamB